MTNYPSYLIINDAISICDLKQLQNVFKNLTNLALEISPKRNVFNENFHELDDKIMDLYYKHPEKIKKIYEIFNKTPEIIHIISVAEIQQNAKNLLQLSNNSLILVDKEFCLTIPNGKIFYNPNIKIEGESYINMWIPFIHEEKFILDKEIEIILEAGQVLLAKNSMKIEPYLAEKVGYYIRGVYFDAACDYKDIYIESLH